MTADGDDPSGQPPAPQGPPIFVNPDELKAQGYAAPTFVKHDGTPVSPAAPPAPVAPGAPTFVLPGATQAPAQPGQPFGQPVADAAPGYTVAGGTPGGPVFLKKDERGAQPAGLDDERPWRWWLGLVAFVIAFAAVFVLGIVFAIAVEASGGDFQQAVDDNQHWFGLAQDFLWVGVVLLVPFLAVRSLRPEDLGIKRQRFWRSVGIGALCMFAFYLLAGGYSKLLGLDEDSNTLLKDTGFGDSVGRDVAFALLFTVAAPVAEELLFRGVLFRSLRDGFLGGMGKRSAVALGAIISGVIFGGIHVGGGQDKFLPVLMVLGILLALAYQWSGTLYVPVAIHAINNALATGLNSNPSEDWIFVLIALGPFLAIASLWLIGRFIRAVFPQEPPEAPAPPTGAPPVAPQFFPPAGGAPFAGPPSDRPANL